MRVTRPFPRRSLPQAGESLREAFLGHVDRVVMWAMLAATILVVAAAEWIHLWPISSISTTVRFTAISDGACGGPALFMRSRGYSASVRLSTIARRTPARFSC